LRDGRAFPELFSLACLESGFTPKLTSKDDGMSRRLPSSFLTKRIKGLDRNDTKYFYKPDG
jgi:hypothetical protein